jgi:hypothetical protein
MQRQSCNGSRAQLTFASGVKTSIFLFRQGLWNEGLRTPPGQECSNGSLTFLAVVLWRIFVVMKLMKVKTARFADVVKKSGQPQSYTLWLKPAADPQLKKLLDQNRIMTIRRGAGADFGEVRFHKAKSTIYLQFPKSLKRFEGQRIVGIKWHMVKS